MTDYEESVTQDTLEILAKEKLYADLAYKNGDMAYREKPGQIIIKIRMKKDK